VVIWVIASFYGLMACFPDKVLGNEVLNTTSSRKQDPQRASTSLPFESSEAMYPTRRPDPDLNYCPMLTIEENTLDSIQLYLSLYIPATAGPVISLVLLVVLSPCLCLATFRREPGMDAPPLRGAWSGAPGGRCSWLLTPLLSLTYMVTYYVHMVYSEHLQISAMDKLMVKYQVGFLHIIIFPVLTVLLRADVRAGVRKTMHGRVLCRPKLEQQRENYHNV